MCGFLKNPSFLVLLGGQGAPMKPDYKSHVPDPCWDLECGLPAQKVRKQCQPRATWGAEGGTKRLDRLSFPGFSFLFSYCQRPCMLARERQWERQTEKAPYNGAWSHHSPFSISASHQDFRHVCTYVLCVYQAAGAGIWTMIGYVGSSSLNH